MHWDTLIENLKCGGSWDPWRWQPLHLFPVILREEERVKFRVLTFRLTALQCSCCLANYTLVQVQAAGLTLLLPNFSWPIWTQSPHSQSISVSSILIFSWWWWSRRWDETTSLNCGHQLTHWWYCDIYEHWEPWLNDIGKWKLFTSWRSLITRKWDVPDMLHEREG
jgi:hypothetical protein